MWTNPSISIPQDCLLCHVSFSLLPIDVKSRCGDISSRWIPFFAGDLNTIYNPSLNQYWPNLAIS